MTVGYAEHVVRAYREFATASVADAVEQMGARGYLSGRIRQMVPGRMVGPAVTVREVPCTDPQPPTHALQAIDEAPHGSVVCIDAGGADVAVWGGLMAAGAVTRGLAGAVLDGCVRDVEEIRRDYSELPVYARGSVAATTVGRYCTVSMNQPVVLGDVTVHPADLIVADADGVVRVPAEHVQAVAELAREIERREAEQTRLIRESGSLRDGLAKYNRV